MLPATRMSETLTAYRKTLEGDDTTDETALWHLLRDIIEFCEARQIDLAALIEDASDFEL